MGKPTSKTFLKDKRQVYMAYIDQIHNVWAQTETCQKQSFLPTPKKIIAWESSYY